MANVAKQGTKESGPHVEWRDQTEACESLTLTLLNPLHTSP